MTAAAAAAYVRKNGCARQRYTCARARRRITTLRRLAGVPITACGSCTILSLLSLLYRRPRAPVCDARFPNCNGPPRRVGTHSNTRDASSGRKVKNGQRSIMFMVAVATVVRADTCDAKTHARGEIFRPVHVRSARRRFSNGTRTSR